MSWKYQITVHPTIDTPLGLSKERMQSLECVGKCVIHALFSIRQDFNAVGFQCMGVVGGGGDRSRTGF